MSTYKRPLPDGVACEDTRVAFNPNLGAAKAKEVEVVEKPKATTRKSNVVPEPVVPVLEEAEDTETVGE